VRPSWLRESAWKAGIEKQVCLVEPRLKPGAFGYIAEGGRHDARRPRPSGGGGGAQLRHRHPRTPTGALEPAGAPVRYPHYSRTANRRQARAGAEGGARPRPQAAQGDCFD
jgi:hypothetical protein